MCFSVSSQSPELGHQKGTATLGWSEKGSHAVCTTHSLPLDLGLWKMAKKQRFKGFSWLWKSVVEQGSSHVVGEGEGREGKEKTKEPRLDDSLASFLLYSSPQPGAALSSHPFWHILGHVLQTCTLLNPIKLTIKRPHILTPPLGGGWMICMFYCEPGMTRAYWHPSDQSSRFHRHPEQQIHGSQWLKTQMRWTPWLHVVPSVLF